MHRSQNPGAHATGLAAFQVPITVICRDYAPQSQVTRLRETRSMRNAKIRSIIDTCDRGRKPRDGPAEP